MKKRNALPDLGAASMRVLSRMTGIDRSRVQNALISNGILPSGKTPNGYGTYDIATVINQIVTDLQEQTPDQHRRKAYWQSELMRLRIAAEIGELVPRAEVERTYGSVFQTIAMLIDILPDLIEREGGDRDAVIRVARRLDQLRVVLAEQLRTFETPSE